MFNSELSCRSVCQGARADFPGALPEFYCRASDSPGKDPEDPG